ncbi:FAD/NAD(P)-binding domain-containing protein [Polychaeton citri CBS 116435]|uniref:FAD/NAD(P)-binding domain-containing protein n=1 Tax=Polychaeton citri CBS 116435 TaxID=1314669 RepID=A0A9P4USX6_9PEZI|nr:FAD/NAD(P)-binding domain-containing protein [Polychaeton citri CBS 116435]
MENIQKIIIIGGGPAGLVAALRLKQIRHVLPVVYELRPTSATLGGAVAIPSNGLRLLDRLGLYENIMAKGAETPNMALHSLKGTVMGKVSMTSWSKQQTGFGYVRITRADLMDVLLDAVNKAAIQIVYGKEVVSIEESDGKVTTMFSDGTNDQADFLLGCDGIHSTVRRLYVDPGCVPEYSGISNMFSIIEASDLPSAVSMLENLNVTLTADGLFGLTPTSPTGNILYWFFSRQVPVPTEGASRYGWEEQGRREIETWKSTMLNLFGNAESEWMSLLRELVHKTNTVKFYPIYKVTPGRPWYKGRCLLIGDAAHAMPPHASQGVSMALEDVFLFCKLLSSKCEQLDDGLRAYEQKRRARTDMMMRTAERNGTVRQKSTPWRLWITEITISWGLCVYEIIGLGKVGFGQRSLAYDVDGEQF